MVRKPSKRLGSQLDGQEIKEHPFFADIDWDDIYNKKFVPPKFDDKFRDPKYKTYDYICNREISEDIKQGKKNMKNNIAGWSFIKG